MPRKSAASLSVALPSLGARPSPPSSLSARQKALWTQIVGSLPSSWFGDENLHVLSALVAHIESFELIEREMRGATDLGDTEKLTWYDKLSKLRERESRAVASMSTKLRITQQAKYSTRAAATAAERRPGKAAPWEVKTG